jgi:hypothetical protein
MDYMILTFRRFAIVVVLSAACVITQATPARAQIRGLYTPGMNAINSGVLPEAGLTYVALFQPYSFDEAKGPDGNRLPFNGKTSVLVDQNIFLWVSKMTILGGTYAAMADLPVANTSLTSVRFGALAAASGFADSYYSPVTLGWHEPRADLQASYGLMAPTGRFQPGSTDNTGGGYWGQFLSAGQTMYITADKATAVSAYEVYEFHGPQEDTHVNPGQTFDVDYSLTQMLPLTRDKHTLLQLGVVGYGQYQTTDTTRPIVTVTDTPYRVNAFGGTAGIVLPERKVGVNVKYLKEFSNQATVEGHSLQISAGVTF